jgi:hypothetical protein
MKKPDDSIKQSPKFSISGLWFNSSSDIFLRIDLVPKEDVIYSLA